MGNATILKKLSKYLALYDVERLKLNLVLKGSIIMCLAITDIVKNYNSTQENENEVAHLLSNLCSNHFKAPEQKKINNRLNS